MKRSYFILFTLIFCSCSSYRNPRQIKEAHFDGLKYESLQRYDKERLGKFHKSNAPLSMCHRGEFDDANRILKKELDRRRNQYKYWNEISTCYILQKKYTQAKSFLELALGRAKNKKEKSIVLNNFGVIYMENNNFHEAKEYFKKSIELSQTYLTPKYNLSQIYLKYGLYKKAQKNIDFLLSVNSQDVDFLNSKAYLELMLQKHKSALVFFNKIPVQYRSRDDIATNLAMTYYMLGLYDNAESIISSADKKSPYYINAQVEIKERINKINNTSR